MFSIRFDLTSTVLATEVIKWKIIIFHGNSFSLITFLIWKIWKWHHRVCRTEPVQNMYFLTLKGQFRFYLRSCQVKVRSWHKQINMHILPSGLTSQVVWHHLRVSISIMSWAIGEERIVTSCDLRRTSRDPRSSVAPGSSQMGWVVMILKELGVFGQFMRNGKHFHISP